MAEQKDKKQRWAQAGEEAAQARTNGHSPEKAAQHRKPGEKDPMDVRAPNVGGSGFA